MYIPETLARISFTLSREEVFVILHLLKASELPGVDLSGLRAGPDGEEPEGLAYSLDAAIKSLVARGYLIPLRSWSDEPLACAPPTEASQQRWARVSIQPEVMALMGVCAFPAKSLRLRWRKASGEDMLYIHEREGLVVVNTSSLPEIYTFTALENWEAALSVIENILEIAEQHASEPPLPMARLDAETLTAIRNELHKNELNEVLDRFRAGLPALTEWTFAETILHATAFASMTVSRKDKSVTSDIEQQRLSVVLTANTCFVLEPQAKDSEAMQVYQASATEVRKRVSALWSE
jgi:hypothetical protein